MEEWNGVSLLWDLGLQKPNLEVYTDVSGMWECGALLVPMWFHLEWSDRLCPLSIAMKEMFPVVMAAATFGDQWAGKVVQFVVNNIATVEVIKATYSKDLHVMHLIRLLVFFASKYNFWFTATYIPGKLNVAADALSRNNMSVFFMQAPQADPQPTAVAPALHGFAVSTRHHMDMQELEQAVQRYFAAGLTSATHKTYLLAECHYLNFCSSFSFVPLPTLESILCYFAACLGQQGMAHTFIRTYLVRVRQLQITYGWNDPGIYQMPRSHQILKGIKAECGKKGNPSHLRLPITLTILRKLKAIWLGGNNIFFNETMLWATSLTTFFSFCCSNCRK